MKHFLCVLTAAVLLVLTCNLPVSRADAGLNTVSDLSSLIESTIGYLITRDGAENRQDWLDGKLSDCAGASSEWYVIALRQHDAGLDYTYYANTLAHRLEDGSAPSGAVERERCALSLMAIGRGETDIIGDILGNCAKKQGVAGLIFGLHLQNNGASCDAFGDDDLENAVISAQNDDGGWSLSGDESDADLTAMAIQALAPRIEHKTTGEAVGKAVAFLSEKQSQTGGFVSYGSENAECAAQVIIALTSLGIDPGTDSRFIKNGNSVIDALLRFHLEDGAFCHNEGKGANSMATVQALTSLVALWRFRSGLCSFFVFEGEVISNTPGKGYAAAEAPANNKEASGWAPGYKVYSCAALVLITAAVCLALWLSKKRGLKNYIIPLAVCAVAIILVCSTDIQTAKSYYGGTQTTKDNISGTVTMSIRCDTVAGETGADFVPADGIILDKTVFAIDNDDTVFDILTEAAAKYSIHVEHEGTTIGSQTVYVTGIGHIYEFDFGALSGWTFLVNGAVPSKGCAEFTLSDKDTVEWVYSRDLWNDIQRGTEH